MQLQGSLRRTTLGDLLGALCRESVSGTLELTEERGPTAGRIHSLHLVRGRIVQIDSPAAVAKIGELLAELGRLDREALPSLIEQARSAQTPIGKRLVDAGLLTSDVVIEALRMQITRRLEALFRLEDARVTFRLVRSRRRELDVSKPLEPADYLLGRPRARDRGQRPTAAAAVQNSDGIRERDLRLLGLGPIADERMIRSAFRRLAQSLHPDRHPLAEPDEVESFRRRFVDVSAAYHRLAG